MNKHMVILPALLIAATSLLLLSISLPEDATGPEVIASATPSPAVDASGEPSAQPGDASASPTPADSGSPGASPAPSAKPSAKPTPAPSPSPTASAADTFGIAATSPDAVLREAQLHAGRMDPFKSMFPPNLPELETALSPEQLALPQLMLPPDPEAAVPVATPRPVATTRPVVPVAAPLEQGLSLKGLIDGGIDPIALIEVNGATEMVRVGERLPGNILVTSIHFEQKRVTLSRGQQKGTLILPTPKTPSY